MAILSDRDWLQHGPNARALKLAERHRLLQRLRAHFDEQGFIEVQTPLMVTSPGLEVHLEAFEVQGAASPQWLSTSPEYHMKRLLSAGFGKIYQICPCFRREELGPLHEPEFTMLEWYRAHAGLDQVLSDTEALVSELATALHGEPAIHVNGRRIDVSPPWPRLSVAEAFIRCAGKRVEDVIADEEQFFRVLVEQVEPELGFDKPLILDAYPASMASLARLVPGHTEIAERAEVYIAGIELCNGYGELTDAKEQRARLLEDQKRRKQLGKTPYPIDERFLAALQQGVAPSGGNALGLDRLFMLLLGAKRIADVMAFPDSRR